MYVRKVLSIWQSAWHFTQQVKDSLLLFLIWAASAEIISKVFNINMPTMCMHNAMPYNDPEDHTKRIPLEFKQT